MRQLHIVERDAEAGHVVLATTDGLEQFELAIDQVLRDAVQPGPAASDGPATPGAARPTTEPRLSPREIQMRIRSGETAQSIAASCGAALDAVMRFAGPVLAERERMAAEARRAKARRSTTDGQTVIFGEAVDERFAAHGIEPATVRWDAHRREDAQWIITAHWIGGQTERTAEWSFHLAARTVAPIDDTAADLLSDRPIRPVVTEPEVVPEVAPGLALAPPLEPDIVSFPAMPDAHTGPLPRTEDVFDQAQFDAPQFDGPQFDAPQLPMQVPDDPAAPQLTNLGVARRDDETEEQKAARATVPSWDDILLGVRRKHD